MAERMTVRELAALPGTTVGSKEAAAVLGCDRYALNIAAKQGTLHSLQYFFSGNRLKISKASLLKFCGVVDGEEGEEVPDMVVSAGASRMRMLFAEKV